MTLTPLESILQIVELAENILKHVSTADYLSLTQASKTSNRCLTGMLHQFEREQQKNTQLFSAAGNASVVRLNPFTDKVLKPVDLGHARSNKFMIVTLQALEQPWNPKMADLMAMTLTRPAAKTAYVLTRRKILEEYIDHQGGVRVYRRESCAELDMLYGRFYEDHKLTIIHDPQGLTFDVVHNKIREKLALPNIEPFALILDRKCMDDAINALRKVITKDLNEKGLKNVPVGESRWCCKDEEGSGLKGAFWSSVLHSWTWPRVGGMQGQDLSTLFSLPDQDAGQW